MTTGPGAAFHSVFGGFAVGTDDVLVKYTFDGDTNLDGRVNISDFFRTDTGKAMRRDRLGRRGLQLLWRHSQRR